ncbi:hypothetical protein GCM10023206_06800 [Acinetobacter puyangensis]|uniref:Phage portal protein, lambda family n=1 Tax=Acinetobacter puyangensis TaxID=1096779 RepID=A0A240E6V4_9GAMM|nr:hypothetical protein [Acinetobacter puyangensis]SNX44241.1 hypothetical protein SAMN05421731_102402 [Acinetobacter puyangensis]
MAAQDILAILLGADSSGMSNLQQNELSNASQESMARIQDSLNPFSLGTFETKDNKKRTRMEIYSKWEKMLRFAPISEAMGIHVTAALGGDATTSQQVFITPAQRLRGGGGTINKAQLEKLEKRIKPMEKLINKHIVKICRDAIGFGDGYTRVYGTKGMGIVDLMANEFTYPPLIQAYEQVNKTVAYQALDYKNWQKVVSKLNMIQMLRLKMPRISHVPQYHASDSFFNIKTLQVDNINEAPIVPAPVGGSYCADVEPFYDNIILALSTMNSQQIADAVNQVFLSVNMSAMPPAQRDAYKNGLNTMMRDHEKFVRDALEGGDSIWNTKYHFLPTNNEKQILNTLGDLKGQRTSPINTETLMINIRLLMGGLGLDPSMVGWADMLAGGLGDGSAFHTSAQIMRRSMMQRQATMDFVNQILALDWGYAYNEEFNETNDYPWKIEYYSDQSAAMTEAITNQQQRMNNLMLKAQAIASLKDLGLSEETITRLLERDGGMDYDEAIKLAKDLVQQREQEQLAGSNNSDDLPTDDQNIEEEEGI